MFRWLLVLLTVAALSIAALYGLAGRGSPPVLSIDKPNGRVGQRSDLQVTANAPGAKFTALTIALEQNGRTIPLFALDQPASATLSNPSADQLRIVRPFGKTAVPELQAGSARIVATATRASFLNLRQFSSTASKDIEVRLEPPRLAVLSSHHYVNHGGSEMVVYRATPEDVISGVRVGMIEYSGFPAKGAGITAADPATKVAFFTLSYDQDLHTPIVAFARDDTGNEVKASFIDNVFEKPFRKSRIEIDDRFLGRVVPEIIEHSYQLKPPPTDDLLPDFLKINGELRQINSKEIATLAARTSPSMLWHGPFLQLGNSQVEASFADQRTYMYKGKEIDRQVHLGFDLAVTARVPVVAANDGVVLNASWLGIYGNCVIIDHGMGVASLYGHLSSIDVKVGDHVSRGQTLGRTGMTGLAGGDHLHFTMLVAGNPANPVEWWDPHWIEDRIERKLHEAAGPP
jgi:murein DD-endopeptidase MepM/ murein hydrolase activator NlpD